METLYVTTTIPYVNARPHVGFALELVQADALARYARQVGMRVRFQTGTDENARKNVESARAAGISPREFVAANSQAFRDLAPLLGVEVDEFVQTSEVRHGQAVQALWKSLRAGDLYQKTWEGLYCSGCEEFLNARDLEDGQCPDHRRAPVLIREKNWFFRLSAWQNELEEALVSGRIRIVPEKRREEILSFVRRGLEDISVSRSADRSEGWGVGVPDDGSQIVYVWIDALVNYLTGLGFPDAGWDDFWGPAARVVHLLGKNVWKFHALYWPALLLSAGLPVPDELVVHGFLTVDGQKIGKSLGNAIDPAVPVGRWGIDPVRYYLLSSVSLGTDGDFSQERLEGVYRRDLANNLGNLVNRVLTLWQRCGSVPTRFDFGPGWTTAPEGFHEAMAIRAFDQALLALWTVFDDLNREIDQAKPWEGLKRGDCAALVPLFAGWTGRLLAATHWLAPFLPETSRRIQAAFEARPLVSGEVLFPREGRP